MPSDGDIVAAVLTGDQAAARELDQRFRARVQSLARQRGLVAEDAQDVAQETLFDVFRQLASGRFRGEAALGTWVYRIASNKIIDCLRAHGSRPAVELPVDIATRPPSAQIVVSTAEDVAAVAQALNRMAVAERGVLLLHDREGWTLEEIGRLFGLKKSAVGERLERARASFRDAFLGTGTASGPERLTD